MRAAVTILAAMAALSATAAWAGPKATLDAGVEGDRGVTQDEVFAVFAENTDRMRGLLMRTLAALPEKRDCACSGR